MPGAFNQVCREEFIGCHDHLSLAQRHDVVVFRTPPLTEDVEIAGYLKVVLYGSSSALDTDFTAKLVDEHPPNADYPHGYAMNLADGILRARYRGGRDKQVLMQPGTAYEFVIEPYPTANVFKKGHRIRVDISSSNFPRFDVNPNTRRAHPEGPPVRRGGEHGLSPGRSRVAHRAASHSQRTATRYAVTRQPCSRAGWCRRQGA